MLLKIQNFLKERKKQKGQGVVEYALIIAFVIAICSFVLTSDSEYSIGKAIKGLFTNTSQQITNAGTQINNNNSSEASATNN